MPVPVESAGQTLYDQYRYVAIQYEFALQRALEEHGSLSIKVDFKPLLVTLGRLCFAAGVEEEDCVKWTMLYLGESDLGSGDPGDLEAVLPLSLRF